MVYSLVIIGIIIPIIAVIAPISIGIDRAMSCTLNQGWPFLDPISGKLPYGRFWQTVFFITVLTLFNFWLFLYN